MQGNVGRLHGGGSAVSELRGSTTTWMHKEHHPQIMLPEGGTATAAPSLPHLSGQQLVSHEGKVVEAALHRLDGLQHAVSSCGHLGSRQRTMSLRSSSSSSSSSRAREDLQCVHISGQPGREW